LCADEINYNTPMEIKRSKKKYRNLVFEHHHHHHHPFKRGSQYERQACKTENKHNIKQENC
jgi:hypothetical protein